MAIVFISDRGLIAGTAGTKHDGVAARHGVSQRLLVGNIRDANLIVARADRPESFLRLAATREAYRLVVVISFQLLKDELASAAACARDQDFFQCLRLHG